MNYCETMNALYRQFQDKKLTRKQYELRIAVLEKVEETMKCLTK